MPGVIDTSVGYTQGKEDKPTYDFVCTGFSGHTEAVQVFYDPKQVSFEALCEVRGGGFVVMAMMVSHFLPPPNRH